MLAAETGSIAFPILTALILVPVLGSLLVAVLPASRPELPKVVALDVERRHAGDVDLADGVVRDR